MSDKRPDYPAHERDRRGDRRQMVPDAWLIDPRARTLAEGEAPDRPGRAPAGDEPQSGGTEEVLPNEDPPGDERPHRAFYPGSNPPGMIPTGVERPWAEVVAAQSSEEQEESADPEAEAEQPQEAPETATLSEAERTRRVTAAGGRLRESPRERRQERREERQERREAR